MIKLMNMRQVFSSLMSVMGRARNKGQKLHRHRFRFDIKKNFVMITEILKVNGQITHQSLWLLVDYIEKEFFFCLFVFVFFIRKMREEEWITWLLLSLLQ